MGKKKRPHKKSGEHDGIKLATQIILMLTALSNLLAAIISLILLIEKLR